jgi:hypothetical protein
LAARPVGDPRFARASTPSSIRRPWSRQIKRETAARNDAARSMLRRARLAIDETDEHCWRVSLPSGNSYMFWPVLGLLEAARRQPWARRRAFQHGRRVPGRDRACCPAALGRRLNFCRQALVFP